MVCRIDIQHGELMYRVMTSWRFKGVVTCKNAFRGTIIQYLDSIVLWSPPRSRCPDRLDLWSDHLRAHTCERWAQFTRSGGEVIERTLDWTMAWNLSDQRWTRAQLDLIRTTSNAFFPNLYLFFFLLRDWRGNHTAVSWSETHLESDCADQNQGFQIANAGPILKQNWLMVDQDFFWKDVEVHLASQKHAPMPNKTNYFLETWLFSSLAILLGLAFTWFNKKCWKKFKEMKRLCWHSDIFCCLESFFESNYSERTWVWSEAISCAIESNQRQSRHVSLIRSDFRPHDSMIRETSVLTEFSAHDSLIRNHFGKERSDQRSICLGRSDQKRFGCGPQPRQYLDESSLRFQS